MRNAGLKPDIYGDLGAIPDASWTERWACFTTKQMDAYMRAVAHWGPLSLAQMEYLIQGLPPPPKNWMTPPTCMVEFEPQVERLRQDIQRGAFPKAATADELAGWCDHMGAGLPAPLVEELQKPTPCETEHAALAQSTAPICYPAWVPLPQPPTIAQGTKPAARGRPQKDPSRIRALVETSVNVLMSAAREGQTMTLQEVAEAVKKLPCGQGMTVSNITRRLKSKLPIDQAKATATKNGGPVAARGAHWRT
jgi:hypothetical protein